MTRLDEYRGLTRNVCRIYRAASVEEVAAGLAWYDTAFTLCERVAWLNGYTVTAAACALAHLSPRVTWGTNLGLLSWLLAGNEKPGFALSRSWENASRAIACGDPLSSFASRAHKTRNFARAIMGDRNAVVVDIWTARAVGLPERAIRTRSGYLAASEAFYRGALRLDVSPRDLQAVAWVHIRGAAA